MGITHSANDSCAVCGQYTTTESCTTPATETDNTTFTEACPPAHDITLAGCRDAMEFDAGDVVLEGPGRILQLTVKLKNVCPNRRVALAVILSEVDDKGEEHKRGLKTLVIPAHDRSSCRDVTVRCIKFVLPEELSTAGTNSGICPTRKFKARFIAHYIDHDFACCTGNT